MLNQDRASYCKTCKAAAKGACSSCDWAAPSVLPANRRVLAIWQFAQTQWRASGFGLIGIDLPAVFQIADKLGIEVDTAMLRSLRVMEDAYLASSKPSTSLNASKG